MKRQWLPSSKKHEWVYYVNDIPVASVRQLNNRFRAHVKDPLYYKFFNTLSEAQGRTEMFILDCEETPKKKFIRSLLSLVGVYAIFAFIVHEILN